MEFNSHWQYQQVYIVLTTRLKKKHSSMQQTTSKKLQKTCKYSIPNRCPLRNTSTIQQQTATTWNSYSFHQEPQNCHTVDTFTLWNQRKWKSRWASKGRRTTTASWKLCLLHRDEDHHQVSAQYPSEARLLPSTKQIWANYNLQAQDGTQQTQPTSA